MFKSFSLIDKPTFFGALFLLISVVLPLMLYPEQGADWIATAKNFMTDKLGVFYLTLGLTAVFFMIYTVFSDFGQIKLGDVGEKPEFATASWAAMLFCGGIGASILYWGCIEWAYYYQSPPFQLEAGSEEAIRWAATYGLFHWGPIAWSIYLIPAVPIAYFFYVRKQSVLKISSALMPVIGEQRANSLLGKLIDVFFIFGMLGGAATTLGLAAPLINGGLQHLFNIPNNTYTQVIVLLICTGIFGYSAYAGLEKGIKFLSNVNFWGAMGLLAFILCVGPTVFMLETGLDSIGRIMSNFFIMATWAEPFGGYGAFADTHFPQDWTIFYWAWWLVFAPCMGLFVARISRGRTIKQMVVGSIFYGSLGCFMFFIVLGNYGLSLQLTDQLDVIQILNVSGAPAAIFAILDSLPFGTVVVGVFTVLCIIFTATTFDSISYILASVVQNNVTEEPLRWNRLFWAFALSFLPTVLMFMGGLSTLQTAAIVGGLPLLVISVMLMISFIRAASLDIKHQEEYEEPTINIEEFPDIDPWSTEGRAFTKFENCRDLAQQAAEEERLAMNELFVVRKEIRAFVLEHYDDAYYADQHLPDQLQKKLDQAVAAVDEAKEKKMEFSVKAQQARLDFNQIVEENAETASVKPIS